MSPLAAALIVALGCLVGVWLIWVRLESHMRETTRILHDCNAVLLARLDQMVTVPEREREALALMLLERQTEPGLPSAHDGGASAQRICRDAPPRCVKPLRALG